MNLQRSDLKDINDKFLQFDPVIGIFCLLFYLIVMGTWFPTWVGKVSKIQKMLLYSILGRIESNGNIVNIVLFFLIALFNLLSFIPHTFCFFAHWAITLALALTSWLCANLSKISYFKSLYIVNIVPKNTPMPLIPFLIFIECVRTLVQPLTLSIRLRVNLTVGHLILEILLEYRIIIILFQILFMYLELLIAVVQSYVFTLLSRVYFK